eukprot:1943746-Pyramimonas_sp.AAC.1
MGPRRPPSWQQFVAVDVAIAAAADADVVDAATVMRLVTVAVVVIRADTSLLSRAIPQSIVLAPLPQHAQNR